MSRILKRFLPLIYFSLPYAMLASTTQVKAAVYTDRTTFNAASQNLRSYNFDDQQPSQEFPELVIDGIIFKNNFASIGISGAVNKVVFGQTFGEGTRVVVSLPPGTTAVGFDQFTAPMKVSISGGEEFAFTNNGSPTFVGFTSDVQIRSLTFHTDPSPNFAGPMILDNLLVGQKSTGNQPPAPILFSDEQTGRAIALDSVTSVAEPFSIVSQFNFGTDHRTRITLFAVNVGLSPGGDASGVVAQAEDAQHRIYNLPVEFVGRSGFSWLTQIVIELTDELKNAGDSVGITISVHGAVSNKVMLRITPSSAVR